jgi:hypothetical protein
MVIDMLNHYEHEDAEPFAASARRAAAADRGADRPRRTLAHSDRDLADAAQC